MAFDPDEYLNERGTSSTAKAEFDPDAYLRETEEQDDRFNKAKDAGYSLDEISGFFSQKQTDPIKEYESSVSIVDGLAKTQQENIARYNELAQQQNRTPEVVAEMVKSFNAAKEAEISFYKQKEQVDALRPEVDRIIATQQKEELDSIQRLEKNPDVAPLVPQLLGLRDQRQAKIAEISQTVKDPEERNKAIQQVQADYVSGFRGSLETVNKASSDRMARLNQIAGALKASKQESQKEVETQAMQRVGMPAQAAPLFVPQTQEADRLKKIDDSLADLPVEEREQYKKEAQLILDLASGAAKQGIVNNKLEVSPSILFDDEAVNKAVAESQATDTQKEAFQSSLPQLRKAVAEGELPALSQWSEFNDFVKENNLQDATPFERVSKFKNADRNWFSKAGMQTKIGLAQAHESMVGQIQATIGSGLYAYQQSGLATDPKKVYQLSQAFAAAAGDQQQKVEDLGVLSQAVGGPTYMADIANTGYQMVPIIASSYGVGLAARAAGVPLKIASDIAFSSAVGAAGLQSYSSVYMDATEAIKDRLIKESIDLAERQLLNQGIAPEEARKQAQSKAMNEDKAREAAMRQAYLPAVVSGLSTATITALGGKFGPEALTREAVLALPKNKGYKQTVKGFLKDVGINAGAEAAEEASDQFIQGVVAKLTYEPEKTMGDIMVESLYAGGMGAVFGAGGGAIEYAATKRSNRLADEKIARDEELKRKQSEIDGALNAAQNASGLAPASADAVVQAANQTQANVNQEAAQKGISVEESGKKPMRIPATFGPFAIREGESEDAYWARIDAIASETPEQRVARLQQEAKAAAGITLEEVPSPEAAQARITEREGKAATPVETPAGTRIEAAAYQAPDGTVYYGASHLDAMAKARDAGKIDQAAIDAKQEVTSRETPEFGFATDKEAFIGRSQAEVVATGSGQMLVDKPATGLLHSNEVSLDAFAQPAKPTQPITTTRTVADAIRDKDTFIYNDQRGAVSVEDGVTVFRPFGTQDKFEIGINPNQTIGEIEGIEWARKGQVRTTPIESKPEIATIVESNPVITTDEIDQAEPDFEVPQALIEIEKSQTLNDLADIFDTGDSKVVQEGKRARKVSETPEFYRQVTPQQIGLARRLIDSALRIIDAMPVSDQQKQDMAEPYLLLDQDITNYENNPNYQRYKASIRTEVRPTGKTGVLPETETEVAAAIRELEQRAKAEAERLERAKRVTTVTPPVTPEVPTAAEPQIPQKAQSLVNALKKQLGSGVKIKVVDTLKGLERSAAVVTLDKDGNVNVTVILSGIDALVESSKNPEALQKAIEKIADEEADHVAAIKTIGYEGVLAAARRLSPAEREAVAKLYISRSNFATDAEYNNAVKEFAATKDGMTQEQIDSALQLIGFEYLRQVGQRVRSGQTTEDIFNAKTANPSVVKSVLQYLAKLASQIQAKLKVKFDANLQADLNRIEEYRKNLQAVTKPETPVVPTFTKGEMVRIKFRVPTYEGGKVVGGRDELVAGSVTRIMPDGKIEVRMQRGGYQTLAPNEVQKIERTLLAAKEAETKKQNIKTNMIRFASGMSGISDLRAGSYTRAGFKNYGVGFDVGLLSKNAIEELADFIINMDTQAFIDSGAFSNFRKSLKAQEGGKTVEALNFDKIFEKYDAILDAIQRINVSERTDYPRPMIVMPDIIGDQGASLDLIDQYKNRVALEVSSNTSIPIIPIPLGELSLSEAYDRIIEILKTNTIGSEINPENFVVGIPSNAKAVSREDLAKFLRKSQPPRIHFLGAAADKNISPLIDIVSQNSPETQVTADASKVRSAILSGVAKGKTRKQAIFDALYQEDDPEVVLNAATRIAPAPTPEVREARREPAITPQQDRDYLDAVERGDLDAASRVVEDAASMAGFTKKVFRGQRKKGIRVMWDRGGTFTAFDVDRARTYADPYGETLTLLAKEGNTLDMSTPSQAYAKGGLAKDIVDSAFADNLEGEVNRFTGEPWTIQEALDAMDAGLAWDVEGTGSMRFWKSIIRYAENNGLDSLSIMDGGDFGNGVSFVIFNNNNLKLADPVTYDDQGNIIPLSQRFQPEQADIRYRRRVQMGRAGMETSAVEARLQELGFPTGGIIRVVNQPDADFEGRTIILDGKVTGIELNASALKDNAAIDRVLNHEFAESANADGALNKLVERLTPKEKKEINDTITRLRYEERARTSEEAARAIETLAEAWKGRGFFTRAVARVEAWASKLGFKLTRRAAEYIAARNLADINSGFRAAYNRFINVRGEVREGRAEDQAVVDADMGRRSQTELTPQEIDQLEKGEKIRVYRAMQIIDGKLYPPMSALVGGKLRKPTEIGAWEKAEERPDLLDKKGKFVLQKGNKATVPAAYNPYFHTSSSPLNDQFSSAYKRDNLVTVEVEIPASELTSGYKAEGAKDAVGEVRWNAGPVSSKLPADKKRRVFLSRYAKVVRIVPDSEVAEVISGLIEGTNLSIPENTVTPSLRSELEKLGVAITPRPARGQEIRESRREPEAIPTFTEGTPEAATLKEMATSMAKVDAASEAKGGKPETYKISEIASVWMDSGLGERELQDAIVEYTNLTPANAQKVARAIAKQYGLQKQIAEAAAPLAEIAPEPEGAPRKSAVTKLIEQTTGVRKPVVKIQVSESAALKKQIQLKAREARETRKARKEAAEDLAKSITDYVKANPIRGPINSRQAMSITKKALKLDVNNEAAVDRFEMYVERVIENANYDQDLADARALIKRAKAYAKAESTQGNVKTTLEAIANVAPALLDNPFEFNLVVQRYLLGLAPVTAKQYAVMPDADVRRYLESLETQIKDNQEILDRAKAQRILDKQAAYANEKGIPLDEAISILNSEEFLQEKTIEKLEDLTKLLTAMAQESQKDVKAYDDSGATPKQKELISFMRKVNLDSLINEEKKRYIRFANNLLANGATFGMEQFQSIALGQEAAMKAAKDKRLSNKLAAWISPIGGDKAIDTARRIAAKTQSEADTFKNIFGREAVGAFRNILGLNRLDVAQTDSNRAKEQIANEFGEYFKGLRKKYGDDATGFEAKGYAGIAGYLIQTDGNKTEAESIPYRRRLMEQNIVELRKSDKQADLAEADLKERALAQLTGTTNSEILSQLRALNPASYEQLMWVKDVMLPKWRDFLKEHDENFRNQANNYNNPDHLTITYKFPEGQLLPSEMEDVYQQDMIGMRIKQAANSIKRKDHPNLPVSKTGTIANIDINFGYNQYNALVDQVDKAFVAPAWEQVVAFTKAPEFEQVMGGRANALFVKNLLRDIQTSRSRQSITDDEAQLIAGGVRLARKISTQAVLGGITQPLRQVPDQLAKLFFTTGRFDLITKNLLTTAQATPLLSKFPIGRRGDAQAGTQYASQFSELARKVEASVTDRKWAKYRELMNKVGEFWMKPLRGSDVWAAKFSWMSYYEAELNKKGIKMESWEREAELVDTDQDRKDAASYAEWAVDFYGGASDPTKMASLSKQTNNGWKEFAKLVFLPLNSFALQQKNSLISDLRDAYLRTGDRKASVAAIVGTLAGMAAFHGMRIYIIGGLIYPAGKALLMGIFGIDMDEPDEEEKQKQLEDNWRKFKASMYGNIVAGGAGEFAEKAAIDAVNRTAYLWDANINPDSLLNDKGEIMSFRQYEKEVSPLYRFRSYGSSEYSFGLADVLTEQATHALAETQQLMTPEEMEKYTGNEQAYAAFATAIEWMYFFRLMDTDVKRIATDLKRQMDRGVEEREKQLKRIREVR